MNRCSTLRNRRGLYAIAVSGIGLLFGLIAPVGCEKDRSEPQLGRRAPNIFLIVLDAASAPYFGCYGDTHDTSPNIDRLAKESALFEHAYSQTSSTLTSVASLITGVRATTHYATSKTKLSLRFPTLAQLLKEQGTRTYGFIGNPFAGAKELGLDRGYDHCIQVYELPSLQETRSTEGENHFKVTLPEDINEQVLQLLPSFGKGGTFSYIHYLQPHIPYDPPERFLAGLDCGTMNWDDLHFLFKEANSEGRVSAATIRHIEARYRANVRFVDSAVGLLMERLKEAGLYDDALIILTSDHGDAFFKHRLFGHNWTVYDDMTRIPLLFKFPKSENISPCRLNNLVETIDLAPTICDYLGIPIPRLFEGDSLWPLIARVRTELEHPEIITCTHSQEQNAIRVGKYKYIANLSKSNELYDLSSDPDEQKNLIQSEKATAELLDRKMTSTVGVRGRQMQERKSDLRADPRMDKLLRSLGYVGDVGTVGEVETAASQRSESASTQPTNPPTTQPAGT